MPRLARALGWLALARGVGAANRTAVAGGAIPVSAAVPYMHAFMAYLQKTNNATGRRKGVRRDAARHAAEAERHRRLPVVVRGADRRGRVRHAERGARLRRAARRPRLLGRERDDGHRRRRAHADVLVVELGHARRARTTRSRRRPSRGCRVAGNERASSSTWRSSRANRDARLLVRRPEPGAPGRRRGRRGARPFEPTRRPSPARRRTTRPRRRRRRHDDDGHARHGGGRHQRGGSSAALGDARERRRAPPTRARRRWPSAGRRRRRRAAATGGLSRLLP